MGKSPVTRSSRRSRNLHEGNARSLVLADRREVMRDLRELKFPVFLTPVRQLVLLPLAALIFVGVWRVRQGEELRALRKEMSRDEAELTLRSTRAESARHGATAAVDGAGRTDPAKVDWRKVCEAWSGRASSDGMSDMESARLRSQMLEWSAAQLIAALEQIDGSDFDSMNRQKAAGPLIAALVEKDPAAALARSERLAVAGKGQDYSYLDQALKGLAGRDPGAAIAWLDRQNAAGLISPAGQEVSRMFEGALIIGLAQSDPAAAARRLESSPPERRAELLGSMRLSSPEDVASVVRLARDSLKPEEVPGLVASVTTEMLSSGLAPTSALLDRIGATPEERLAVAEKFSKSPLEGLPQVRDLNAEDLRGLHDWMKTQAPGKEDDLTAMTMLRAVFYGGRPGGARIEQAILKSDPDGGGHLLVPFLKAMKAIHQQPTDGSLIDHVADPGVRQELSAPP
ncbi:MAG: hypothetical protein JWO82_4217 [Akkermansiaceae bacterium]|nr:hypothetical protein [Akkermansiaceae bacterium]